MYYFSFLLPGYLSKAFRVNLSVKRAGSGKSVFPRQASQVCMRMSLSFPFLFLTSLCSGIFDYIGKNIRNFEAFYRKKYESVIQREAELCVGFGLSSAPVTIPDLELVEESELSFILFVYESILKELSEIQWFYRVNETAITRIFEKIANGSQQAANDYHPLHAQWLALQHNLEKPRIHAQKRISNLTADIRQVLAVPRQGTRSLYLNNVSANSPERLYRLVKDDEYPAVQKFCLSHNHALKRQRDEAERLFGDLFIAAIMMESRHSQELLFATMLEQDFVMSRDQVSLFLGLCGQQRMQKNLQLATEHWLNKWFDGPHAPTGFFLHEKDSQGRNALHYAAQYGLKEFFEPLLNWTNNSKSPDLVFDALYSADNNDMTPIHYAVLSGYIPLITILLKGLSTSSKSKSKSELASLLGELLLLSVRVGRYDIVEVLLKNQPNFDYISLNYSSARGETAIYCAAQAGNLDMVRLLLRYIQHGIDANIGEVISGWTPLMVACANGHSDVVGCLLEAGVEPEVCDALGWTAREHAVFRGHLGIATLFTSTPSENIHDGPASFRRLGCDDSHQIASEAGKRLVIINLGSTQGGHNRAAFELSQYDFAKDPSAGAAASLVLEISAPGTEAKAKLVQLPVLEDQINQPFVFEAKKNAPLQISVRLYRRESVDSMILLSGGTTMLDHGKVFFGENRESMIREVTIFMMDKETMDLTGNVLLSYVVVKPFAGLQHLGTANYKRRLGDPTRLVGHRVWYYMPLFARYNGSDEFTDLQLTRDLEAVIFHDFSLSESGTDIAIHDVTLAQYKHASDLQEPQSITPASLNTRSGVLHDPPPRRRAWSTGEESRLRTVQLRDRLRYTVDFQNKGFKPNTRGEFIQGSLTTLEELLVGLPTDIGFNIEMSAFISWD
ncbi:ankyrin repeat-containing [Trichoderma arundinaceum]|uniref:Ankyrin repeat-containing n=1 Tax=Trichoderma arundinaceum TaxID=490622 RepID=A0A395NXV2_TRIAR|nr:ankyrin repeat-containing [Trichoderma arundinaceum]